LGDERKGASVADAVFVALIIVAFGLLLLFMRGVDHL
jgi:hypothetical protein